MSTDGWTQRALRFASVGWSSPPVTGSDGCRLGRWSYAERLLNRTFSAGSAPRA